MKVRVLNVLSRSVDSTGKVKLPQTIESYVHDFLMHGFLDRSMLLILITASHILLVTFKLKQENAHWYEKS